MYISNGTSVNAPMVRAYKVRADHLCCLSRNPYEIFTATQNPTFKIILKISYETKSPLRNSTILYNT